MQRPESYAGHSLNVKRFRACAFDAAVRADVTALATAAIEGARHGRVTRAATR